MCHVWIAVRRCATQYSAAPARSPRLQNSAPAQELTKALCRPPTAVRSTYATDFRRPATHKSLGNPPRTMLQARCSHPTPCGSLQAPPTLRKAPLQRYQPRSAGATGLGGGGGSSIAAQRRSNPPASFRCHAASGEPFQPERTFHKGRYRVPAGRAGQHNIRSGPAATERPAHSPLLVSPSAGTVEPPEEPASLFGLTFSDLYYYLNIGG